MLLDERLRRIEQSSAAHLVEDWRRADEEELDFLHRRMPHVAHDVPVATPCDESSPQLRRLQLALAAHNTFYMYARAQVNGGLNEHRARGLL